MNQIIFFVFYLKWGEKNYQNKFILDVKLKNYNFFNSNYYEYIF